MASRSVEDISRELNEVKAEIEQVKQYIVNAISGAERLQHTVRLNDLDVDRKELKAERMFPLDFAFRGFFHRLPMQFALFLCFPSGLFLSSSPLQLSMRRETLRTKVLWSNALLGVFGCTA